ncbi:MAG TPA: Ig-like domain-containing protein [Polyangia bacterium]|nr:Ig-like domain-containing protein [Polyangia bacterium]
MSTGARRGAAIVAAAAAVAGCGSGAGGASGPFLLSPQAAMVQGIPGSQATLTFFLTQAGQPAPGQTVTFTTESSPSTPSAQRPALAAPTGVTDAHGVVQASVHVGAAEFRVKAQFQNLEAEIAVIVTQGSTGTVLVAPFLLPSATPLPSGTPIQIYFYDSASCASLNLDQPDSPVRGVFTTNLGSSVRFELVGTGVVSSAIGQASIGGTAVAKGCIDIPGSSVLADQTVQVNLPLADAIPDPVGTYSVTSTMMFSPPLAAAAPLAAPWADLADCPLDPAQLWLDCTVDALLPATAADPLDCVPAAGAGAEGPVGDAIAALRGVELLDGTGAPTGCRSGRDAAGDQSLDALALGLFGSPLPAPVVALPAIASDAADILDDLRLGSTLTVAPGSGAGAYVVTHTLVNAQFGPTWQVAVPLASLGLPILEATTTATVSDGIMQIGPHGFTLRLGTVARAGFGPLSLVPRGFPADVPTFVADLFALARSPGGAATGCAALDALVCPAAGQPAGCVAAACADGLDALAAKLDGAFDAADGTGLDLMLSGSAPLIDNHGDGMADSLGENSASALAIWTVDLRTSLDSVQVSALLAGMRN